MLKRTLLILIILAGFSGMAIGQTTLLNWRQISPDVLAANAPRVRVASGIPSFTLDHTGETSTTAVFRFRNDGTDVAELGIDFSGTGADTLYTWSSTGPAGFLVYTGADVLRGSLQGSSSGLALYGDVGSGINIAPTTNYVGVFTATAGYHLDVTGTANVKSTLRLAGSTSGGLSITVPATGTDTWIFPVSGQVNNYVLTTDGAGNLTWSDKTGGTPGTITSINGDSSAAQTIAGSTNINIANAGAVHTVSITGLIPDGNISSASTWNAASLIWTDSGTVTRLTTYTDQVTIGADNGAGKLHVAQASGQGDTAVFGLHGATAGGSSFVLRKSRGTIDGPTGDINESVITAADSIGVVTFRAYDGSQYDDVAYIAVASPTVSGGNVSGEIQFWTSLAAGGSPVKRMTVGRDGDTVATTDVGNVIALTGSNTATTTNANNYGIYGTATGAAGGTSLNVGGLFGATGAATNAAIVIGLTTPLAGAANYALLSLSPAKSVFNGAVGIDMVSFNTANTRLQVGATISGFPSDSLVAVNRTTTATAVNAWGINSVMDISDYTPTSFDAKAAILGQCNHRNTNVTYNTDCVGVWGWAMVKDTTNGHVFGVEADVFMSSTSDDGSMIGVGSGLRSQAATLDLDVDSSKVKIMYQGGAVTSEDECTYNSGYANYAACITALKRTITGAVTNGANIRITTSGAHGLTTGDLANVTAVGGCTDANWTHKITSVNSTTLDLQNVTCSSAYTSGGQLIRSMQPITALFSNLNDRYQAPIGFNIRRISGDFIRLGNPEPNAVGIRFRAPNVDGQWASWAAAMILPYGVPGIFGTDIFSNPVQLMTLGSDSVLRVGTIGSLTSSEVHFYVDAVDVSQLNSGGFTTTGITSTTTFFQSGVSTSDTGARLGASANAVKNVYIDFMAADNSTQSLRILRSGGTDGTGSITHAGTGTFQLRTSDAAALSFATTNVERLSIASDGILTASSLTAQGFMCASSGVISSSATTCTGATVATATNASGLTGTPNITVGTIAATTITATSLMTTGAIGNGSGTNDAAVQIGVNSASAKNTYLDFYAQDNSTLNMRLFRATGAGGVASLTQYGVGTFQIATNGAAAMSLATTNVERINVDAAGPITFGTDTILKTQLGAVGAPVLTNVSGTTTGLYFPSATSMAFSVSGTSVVRINSVGLGVNTTPASSPLAASSTTFPAMSLETTTSGTSAGVSVAVMNVESTGTPAAGFGPKLRFTGESTTTALQDMAAIYSYWTTATHASRSSAIDFQTVTAAGSLTTMLAMGGGISIFKDTAGTQLVTIDGAGNVYTGSAGTSDTSVRIGQGSNNAKHTYLDFYAHNNSTVDMRLIRETGVNGVGYLSQVGTGAFSIQTNGSVGLSITSAQVVALPNLSGVGTRHVCADASGNLVICP